MAIVGAGMGGLLRSALAVKWQRHGGNAMATAAAAWASIMLASVAVSVELAMDGQIVFSRVVAAMVGTHGLIGIGEAGITVAACLLLGSADAAKSRRGHVIVPFTAAAAMALALSPFASGFPDGLEWIARKYAFWHASAPALVSPLPDYSVSCIGNERLSTGLSGLAGVMVAFAASWALLRLMRLAVARKQVA